MTRVPVVERGGGREQPGVAVVEQMADVPQGDRPRVVDEIRQERVDAASEQLRPQDALLVQRKPVPAGNPERKALVLVTMGSDSDLPILKAGLDVLEEFKVPYSLNITSAHRTPSYMAEVANEAARRGFKAIIAAGMSYTRARFPYTFHGFEELTFGTNHSWRRGPFARDDGFAHVAARHRRTGGRKAPGRRGQFV